MATNILAGLGEIILYWETHIRAPLLHCMVKSNRDVGKALAIVNAPAPQTPTCVHSLYNTTVMCTISGKIEVQKLGLISKRRESTNLGQCDAEKVLEVDDEP